MLGETVKAKRQTVSLTAFRHFEIQAVGGDDPHVWLGNRLIPGQFETDQVGDQFGEALRRMKDELGPEL